MLLHIVSVVNEKSLNSLNENFKTVQLWQHCPLHNQLQGLRSSPYHRASLSLFSFFEALALMLLLQQMTTKHLALSTTEEDNKEDMQHLGTYIEGPKLPQVVCFVLSLNVDSLSIALPDCYTVQVNSQVSVLSHLSQDGNSVWLIPGPP